MRRTLQPTLSVLLWFLLRTATPASLVRAQEPAPQVTLPPVAAPIILGQEVAIERHLADGDEFVIPLADLLAHGERLFAARWTVQEGGGRPLMKGTGALLAAPEDPLIFPRNFNRVSGPDTNSCAGCHNLPVTGGSGEFGVNVFVLGQRFDFATFAHDDTTPGRNGMDELGRLTTVESIANQRATVGMFGAGYIEMLARQVTAELRSLRDGIEPGASVQLVASGINFGTLARTADGRWDTSQVEGLSSRSLESNGALDPPELTVRPFHQSGTVISLREFSNTAYNHHHGIQSTERFGVYADPDGDGVVDELTRADMTAVTLFQATLPVPGRVIPSHPLIEQAVWDGERLFDQIGCVACHIPSLPLAGDGHIFTEPNPYNPARNLRPGEAPTLAVDLADAALPGPRLPVAEGVVHVPAYTDLKLHDITAGPDDPNAEPLDLNQSASSEGMFEGNRSFLTARLWGVASQPPYFHHGKFTTMREAILAHAGEAAQSRQAFVALDEYERNAVIEFLKSLQVLPPGSTTLVVDEQGRPRQWPAAAFQAQYNP